MADRIDIVAAVLDAELAKPYLYGEADCFFLGCQTADALDPELGLTRRYWRAYSTLAGAQKALRKRGCQSIADLYARHLTRCAPAEARLGDLVIVLMDGGEHVAVCLGRRCRTKTAAGAIDVPVTAGIAAFRTVGAA